MSLTPEIYGQNNVREMIKGKHMAYRFIIKLIYFKFDSIVINKQHKIKMKMKFLL